MGICWGRTPTFKRCERQAGERRFCSHHWWQPAAFGLSLLGVAGSLASIFSAVQPPRPVHPEPFDETPADPQSIGSEELAAQLEAMEEKFLAENRGLKDQVSSLESQIGSMLELIREEQGQLAGDMRPGEEYLERAERVADRLGQTLDLAEETLTASESRDETVSGEVRAELATLKTQNGTLKSENAAFREYLTTGDPDALDPILESLGEMVVAVITSNNGPRAYRADEAGQFAKDAKKVLRDARLERITRGRFIGGGSNCVGSPWDCGELDFGSGPLGMAPRGGLRIQWYSGSGSEEAEMALAAFTRRGLEIELAAWEGSVCRWYSELGAKRRRETATAA